MLSPQPTRLRLVLGACCGAHLVQDGLVALQFVLLPLIAQALGLGYAQVGLLRGLSATTLAALEIPAGILAERCGERRLLVFGLLGAALGYLGIAWSPGFTALLLFFAVAGAGGGFQHSLASSLLVRSFEGAARRRALGAYNAAGDAGKLTFTGLFGLAVGAGLAWNSVVAILAMLALVGAVAAAWALRGSEAGRARSDGHAYGPQPARRLGVKDRRRFALLAGAVYLDSTVQTVFLTFVAFVALDRGLGEGAASAAVVLTLVGGMLGKFTCGLCAARIGDRATFLLLQALTALGLALVALAPGALLLALLPLVGLVVQGSSTVTYGAVGDHAEVGREARAYALVYTFANGAAVTGPLLFGLLADAYGLVVSLWVLAILACLTLFLGGALAPRLPATSAA